MVYFCSAAYTSGGRKKRTARINRVGKMVPVRTFADWVGVSPGYLEMDMVVHCGTRLVGSLDRRAAEEQQQIERNEETLEDFMVQADREFEHEDRLKGLPPVAIPHVTM